MGEIVLVAARGDIPVLSDRGIRAHTRHSAISGVKKTEAERALELFVLVRRLNLGLNPSVFPNSPVAAWNVGPYFLLTNLVKYCPRVMPGVGPDDERRSIAKYSERRPARFRPRCRLARTREDGIVVFTVDVHNRSASGRGQTGKNNCPKGVKCSY